MVMVKMMLLTMMLLTSDFCPTGLLGQLGERWLKTALLRRQGHGNPPMGDAIDALLALGKAKTAPKEELLLGKKHQ